MNVEPRVSGFQRENTSQWWLSVTSVREIAIDDLDAIAVVHQAAFARQKRFLKWVEANFKTFTECPNLFELAIALPNAIRVGSQQRPTFYLRSTCGIRRLKENRLTARQSSLM